MPGSTVSIVLALVNHHDEVLVGQYWPCFVDEKSVERLVVFQCDTDSELSK